MEATLDSICVLGLVSDGSIAAIVLTDEQEAMVMAMLPNPLKASRLSKADGLTITDPQTKKEYHAARCGWEVVEPGKWMKAKESPDA